MNMPAVIALCLQINPEEMTAATAKIAKAILPDRADKQGAQLAVKPAVEAEADSAAPVQPRQGRRYAGSGAARPHRRAPPAALLLLLLGASTALHRAVPNLNSLEQERGRSTLLSHRRDAASAQPGIGQCCGSSSSPEHPPCPAETSQERPPREK